MFTLRDFKRLIKPFATRLQLVIGRAVLQAIEADAGTQRVKILALSNEVIDNVPRHENYGFTSKPTAGECTVLFQGGNRERGVVVCIHDRDSRPTDLADDETMIYTNDDSLTSKHRIHLKDGRVIEVHADIISAVGDTEINLGSLTRADLRKLVDERFKTLYDAHVHTTGAGNTGPPTVAMSNSHMTDIVRAK